MDKIRSPSNIRCRPGCFIIPPPMLERLAASGESALAEMAGRTLRLTQNLAAFRAQLSTGAPPPAAARSTGLKRQVFDCKGTSDLPGDPVRQEYGSASRDKAVNEAYDDAGTTWVFTTNKRPPWKGFWARVRRLPRRQRAPTGLSSKLKSKTKRRPQLDDSRVQNACLSCRHRHGNKAETFFQNLRGPVAEFFQSKFRRG